MNKTLKTILAIVLAALMVVAGLYLIYRMNRIVDSVHFFSSMMQPMETQIFHQFLFVAALVVFGLGIMLSFNRFFDMNTIVIMGFIVGTLLWAVLSTVVLCFGIAFTKWSVIIACVIALVGAIVIGKPRKFTKDEALLLVQAVIVSIGAAFFFSTLCVFRFSYDSLIYINMGERLADFKGLTPVLIPWASGFSVFTSMLYAPAQFFNYDFSQGLNLMLNTQFVLAVAYFIYVAMKEKASKKIALITARASFFLLVGANMFFELMYWPMSNLLTAMTLFFVIYFGWQSRDKEHQASFWLAMFFGVCMVLTRTENALLLIVMLFMLSMLGLSHKRLAIFTTVALGFTFMWYVRFFLVAGISFDKGAFLTIDRALPVIGAYLAMIVYLLFIGNMKWIKANRPKVEGLFFILFFLAIVGLSVLKPDFLGTNLFSTMVNMFRTGGWGLSFFLFFGLYLIRAVLPIKWDLWDKVCLAFVLFHVAIYLLRAMPLRVGYGDSGNRYFAHILPLVTYGIVTKVVPYFVDKSEIGTQAIKS